MFDILAQTGSSGETIVAIATSVVLALGGREGIAAVQRRRTNGAGYNMPLCNERHKNLETDRVEQRESMASLHTKVDALTQHLLTK